MQKTRELLTSFLKSVITYLIIIVVIYYSPPVSLLLTKENRECYQLVRKTMSDYRNYGLKLSLHAPSSYEEKNKVYYFLHLDKFPTALFQKKITPEIISEIRLQMNQYLKKHPDYFLNKSYEINIAIDLGDKKGSLILSNQSDFNLSNQSEYSAGLDYLTLVVAKDFMSVSDILALRDIKGVRLNELYSVTDIIQLIKNGTFDYIELDTSYIERNGDGQFTGKVIDNREKILKEVDKYEENFQDYRMEENERGVVFIKEKIDLQ